MRPLEAALRKARWRLLPLLSVCYLVAYMDRANISFAADTMSRDLGFTPKIYGLGAGLFFVSYALCEVPSNKLLLRFGARRWLARIMLTWGVLAAAMMFVHTSASFYGMRLLLGVAEAGYFPGVVYYLSQWFPPAERARALSRFYVAFPLSSVVMGAVAGALWTAASAWLAVAVPGGGGAGCGAERCVMEVAARWASRGGVAGDRGA
jgi:ACS family tartrate transporter-like MFS transporter